MDPIGKKTTTSGAPRVPSTERTRRTSDDASRRARAEPSPTLSRPEPNFRGTIAEQAQRIQALRDRQSTPSSGGSFDAGAAPAIASRVVRGELSGAPLRPGNAFEAYRNLTADNFAGPDDIRLRQLNRATTLDNVSLVRRLDGAARASGVDAAVYGRAKTPFSIFGKLREAPGVRIGDIKDLSGARLDLDPTQPGFGEYYRAQDAAESAFNGDLKLKQDYIRQPNRWGYTGRIHSTAASASGLTHEVQVGSRDLSQFIDKKLVTRGGDPISLHDATGYKGQIHGANIPDELQGRYTDLLGKITDANAEGKALGDVPELQREVNKFYDAVEEALPERLNKVPDPKLSRGARVGAAATKGFGVLGIVGGGFQAYNGVENLRSGDKIEGGADVAAGSAGIVSGAALVGGRVALGTTAGGAVAVIDGGKDIYTGIRDGDAGKVALGTVKAGAGTALIAGVATANPVLIAGGAIAYGGAVLYENKDAIVAGGKALYGAGQRAATSAIDAGQRAATSVIDAGQRAANRAADAGRAALDFGKSALSNPLSGNNSVANAAVDGVGKVGGFVKSLF